MENFSGNGIAGVNHITIGGRTSRVISIFLSLVFGGDEVIEKSGIIVDVYPVIDRKSSGDRTGVSLNVGDGLASSIKNNTDDIGNGIGPVNRDGAVADGTKIFVRDRLIVNNPLSDNVTIDQSTAAGRDGLGFDLTIGGAAISTELNSAGNGIVGNNFNGGIKKTGGDVKWQQVGGKSRDVGDAGEGLGTGERVEITILGRGIEDRL